jgi:2-polyprenyl-6-methoxyphenol hydroxylase-like FAD-dependent oxidoreductase
VLPHKSSGTISAIEDAEALHLTLRNATRETAHDGLQRAFRMRYKRSMECQAASRKDNLFAPPNPRAMQEIFAQWEYPGAERWETDRPDMILSA